MRTDGEPAFARLRSVLWLLATASGAGFATVLTSSYLHLADASIAHLLGGPADPRRSRAVADESAVQQVATFAGAIALTETGLDRIAPHASEFGYGLALWALAVAWGLAVGRGDPLPRTTGLPAGRAGRSTGAIIAMDADTAAGQAVALVTVALPAVGIVAHRVLLIGIGAAGRST